MITKITYRDQVRELLLDKLRSGDIKPGNSLSLASISRELDVSVTPIREALTQLEHSRIIESVPNRGFIIPELNNEEAKNLYQLVATLESLAIKESNFNEETIKKLKKQQLKFESCKNPIDRIYADMEFHSLLTSNYKNETAQQILFDLKVRIFFYEVKFMEDTDYHKNSENHHNQIIHHLENKQVTKATTLVKSNWLQILNYMTS